jgi:tRNA (adenine22-N1)-methyltransferase
MIKLSQRLETVASFVTGNTIADIGCDHALLDIYLYLHNPKLNLIAIDIKEGAINQAQINLEKYHLQDEISLRLGDGLEVVSEEVDTVVISGLGYHKILDILTKYTAKLAKIKHLIIQSNTSFDQLRKSITKLGYYIKDEALVKENDIIYLIIKFEQGYKKYREIDYLIGPIIMKSHNDLSDELIKENYRKKEILYLQIPHKYFGKRWKIKRELNRLEKIIK